MSDDDRHVIKGRGEHRGRYLCWGRQAPELAATADGFVWLKDQRKAARWPDPRYSGETWATDRARIHSGYFVKLVASKAIIERVPELQAYIYSHAARASRPLACYWFDGEFNEAGDDYCRDCAESSSMSGTRRTRLRSMSFMPTARTQRTATKLLSMAVLTRTTTRSRGAKRAAPSSPVT